MFVRNLGSMHITNRVSNLGPKLKSRDFCNNFRDTGNYWDNKKKSILFLLRLNKLKLDPLPLNSSFRTTNLYLQKIKIPGIPDKLFQIPGHKFPLNRLRFGKPGSRDGNRNCNLYSEIYLVYHFLPFSFCFGNKWNSV